MKSAALVASILCLLMPPSFYPQQQQGFQSQATERVRAIWESKTSRCGGIEYARMGPYAVNQYKDVRFQVSGVSGEKDAVRVQAIGSFRQWWAREGSWGRWARDQILLDLNVVKADRGELQTSAAGDADTSGENLKPIPCDQLPKEPAAPH